MTARRSVESMVEAWLADDFAAQPDSAAMLRDIRAATATTPQRKHRWWPFGRQNANARSGLAADTDLLVPVPIAHEERRTKALFLAHPVKVVVAGIFLALFGGLLLFALPAGRPSTPVAPGVQSASPAPSPSSDPGSDRGFDPGSDPAFGSALIPGQSGILLTSLDGACESAGDCAWGEPGEWEVRSIHHHGDFPGADAMTVGPSGSPWIWNTNACGDRLAGEEFPCVWQIGVPGYSVFPPLTEESDTGDQTWRLKEAPDGVLWAAGTLGLYSFDGETWMKHWSGTTLTDLTIAPDGTILAVGGGPAARGGGQPPDDIIVVQVDAEGVSSDEVDAIARERWPTAIATTSDGDVWVGAIAGWGALAPGESLLARFDGQAWQTVWPFGDDHEAGVWDLSTGPDGSVWATITTHSESEGLASRLANIREGEWHSFVRGDPPSTVTDEARRLEVAPDGNPWFTTWNGATGESLGIGRFAGLIWWEYLEERAIDRIAIGPDGTVWATTIPGFDEESQLIALRP